MSLILSSGLVLGACGGNSPADSGYLPVSLSLDPGTGVPDAAIRRFSLATINEESPAEFVSMLASMFVNGALGEQEPVSGEALAGGSTDGGSWRVQCDQGGSLLTTWTSASGFVSHESTLSNTLFGAGDSLTTLAEACSGWAWGMAGVSADGYADIRVLDGLIDLTGAAYSEAFEFSRQRNVMIRLTGNPGFGYQIENVTHSLKNHVRRYQGEMMAGASPSADIDGTDASSNAWVLEDVDLSLDFAGLDSGYENGVALSGGGVYGDQVRGHAYRFEITMPVQAAGAFADGRFVGGEIMVTGVTGSMTLSFSEEAYEYRLDADNDGLVEATNAVSWDDGR